MFGPDYFAGVARRGLGLGVNPSDFHDTYLDAEPGRVDFFEVTAASARHQGRLAYTDVQERRRRPEGFFRRSAADLVALGRDVLVHSTDLNPVYPEPVAPADLRGLNTLLTDSGSPWVTEDLGVWLMSERHVYPYFTPFPFDETTLATTIGNVHALHANLPVPFNAEFPPCEVITGRMHAFDFFADLVTETGAGMCVDVGHVLSYQLARGVSPLADLHRLPWSHITEIHVAGGGLDLHDFGLRYDDAHGDAPIISVCFDLIDAIVEHAPNLRAIVLEVFGARRPAEALSTLDTVRDRPSVAAWLAGQPRGPRSRTADAGRSRSRIVATFDALHGGAPVDGERLAELGEPMLSGFAVAEQDRWEFHRRQRLQLHGATVAGYFPLTTKWLLHRDGLTELDLFERIVPALTGSDVALHEKVHAAFALQVTADAADTTGAEIYRLESWMNSCAVEGDADQRADFKVSLPALLEAIRSETLGAEDFLRPYGVSLRHKGDCRFAAAAENRVLVEATALAAVDLGDVPGRAVCCSGE
ncbi:hypothetical protein Aab01nite_67060 [Paractinoplanes abujensis]|uniref:Uncharacterized protein (UPF0276 family) n=1 Tax=Paractinoplanes abujensis TaxID=882441 RepID=A0A7W7CVR4_9ACTN|nr:DUF692 family multinuclear iron-containing protein [Actinoplanes abujensis]MBB4695533.1 uncharacterized protein (UPF0276 family) [Actinoplanes abujensis]GID23116.1 hypothetical protein Aab01nite_67060 [Actinoplanes abujensis]